MWAKTFLLVLGCLLRAQRSSSWMCTSNSDCESTIGAFCHDGNCVCPVGQQLVLGGTICADVSPYISSPCYDDHQCSRLITNFKCRRPNDGAEGNCFCREGFHYQNGRCWQSIPYEGSCTRNENCMGSLSDPFSLSCVSGTCQCAPGYYFRQRGECRKIAYAVGDVCIIDEDCQFPNGLCDIRTLRCYDSSTTEESSKLRDHNLISDLTSRQDSVTSNTSILQNGGSSRKDGAPCDSTNPCAEPFVCSSFGICICPVGFFPSEDGTVCYSELGTPSTEEQCVSLFSEIRDGICTCQANFYFEENMKACVKVARIITDSCLSDNMCQTFGAATRCVEGVEPLFLRNCECIPELAVWDGDRNMCRLFVGIGESCQVNSDCLAGELEIECVLNDEGEGVCTCPEGTSEMDGLCLTSGLDLGDSCQATSECTKTDHTVCEDGVCSCDKGYIEIDGSCVPTIGGICIADSDCLTDDMVCVTKEKTNTSTCQCADNFVEYADECWPTLSDAEDTCNVTVQCTEVIGDHSLCQNGTCACLNGFHFRDGWCWPQIGLFESCSRLSECYLGNISDRVECRNSICQCSFNYPYSDELQTCTSQSAASTNMAGLFTILCAIYFLVIH